MTRERRVEVVDRHPEGPPKASRSGPLSGRCRRRLPRRRQYSTIASPLPTTPTKRPPSQELIRPSSAALGWTDCLPQQRPPADTRTSPTSSSSPTTPRRPGRSAEANPVDRLRDARRWSRRASASAAPSTPATPSDKVKPARPTVRSSATSRRPTAEAPAGASSPTDPSGGSTTTAPARRATAYYEADLSPHPPARRRRRPPHLLPNFRRDSFIPRDGATSFLVDGWRLVTLLRVARTSPRSSSRTTVFPDLVTALADAGGDDLPERPSGGAESSSTGCSSCSTPRTATSSPSTTPATTTTASAPASATISPAARATRTPSPRSPRTTTTT